MTVDLSGNGIDGSDQIVIVPWVYGVVGPPTQTVPSGSVSCGRYMVGAMYSRPLWWWRSRGWGVLLDDEALDLVVVEIARPDHGEVGEGRGADPLLLAVEDPLSPSRRAVVRRPREAREPTSASCCSGY